MSLLRCSSGEKLSGDLLEVFHVRAEEDRHTGGNRFRRVLAPYCAEALANESHCSERVPSAEFACGVQQENVGGRGSRDSGSCAHGDTQAKGFQSGANLRGAFHMTRRDDEKEVLEAAIKMLK